MSAQKRRTAEEIEICIKIAKLSGQKVPPRKIASDFGLTTGQVQNRVWLGGRFINARKVLKRDPTNLGALDDLGFMSAGQLVWELRHSYGVERLSQLEGWSRAELLWLNGAGKKGVDEIEWAMQQHGLALHPDRPELKQRQTLQELNEIANDWARKDHAWVAKQANVMLSWFLNVRRLMAEELEDEAFADIARALQSMVYPVNQIAEVVNRVDKEAETTQEVQDAYEARQEANKRIAQLAVRTSKGNVIPFWPAFAADQRPSC